MASSTVAAGESSAYSLAAGGPIVHPLAQAIVLTPIAPHTLTNRAFVFPGTEVVEVRPGVAVKGQELLLTYDGQAGYAVTEDDVVRVRMSGRPFDWSQGPGARTSTC